MKKQKPPFGTFRWRGDLLTLDYYVSGQRQRPPFAKAQAGTAAEKKELERLARLRLDELGVMAGSGLFDNSNYPTYTQIANCWWDKHQSQKEYIKNDHQCSVGERFKLDLGIQFFGDTRCDQIKRTDVKRFRMSITGRKGRNGKAWDNQYINRIVDMVGQVYHWAIGQEIYTYDTADSRERLAYGRVELCVNLENPRHGLPKLPETPKEAIIPTIEQFRKLLDELPKPEFRAFAIIGAHTGLRKRNILGMKIDDINFDRGVIIVSSHKTGKTPIVLSMHPELAWLLRDIVNNRIPEQVYLVETTPGRAYRDFHGVWNRACDRAGVHGFRFESLRNMYTTWRVEEGVSLGLIQQALAHSTVATTAKHYNKAKLATEIIVKTQRNILSKPVPIGDQAGDQLVTKQG